MDIDSQSSSRVAIVYAAKSTADEHGSIPTQIADGRALAEREGATVVEVYDDEAKSAYSGNRGDGLRQAREHAEQLAAEHGECLLIVQHTDRLARGDAVTAEHLIEVVLWARRAGVTIRSKQDDSTCENLVMAVVMGERNHEDSKRKSAAVKAGKRRRAERGQFVSSVIPDGYVKVGDGDKSTLAKDPERAYVIDLIFGMAQEGRSNEAISVALSAKRILTRGGRGKPRAFTTQRVGQTLNCAAYAGLVVYDGEVLPDVTGNWPTYIDAETWHRLAAERERRSAATRRPRGRQPSQHLLRGLARCGVCGGTMITQTEGRARKDGTRRRFYECMAAHQHGKASVEWCAGPRIDAGIADATMIDGLDGVLSDAMRWREAMTTARRADQADLERTITQASDDKKQGERAIENGQRRLSKMLAEDPDTNTNPLEGAIAAAERQIRDAHTRSEAALDALTALKDEQAGHDADAMLARLREAVSSALEVAEGDAGRVNLVLREWLDAVVLEQHGKEIVCIPHLNADAAARIINDPASHERVTVTIDGQEVAVVDAIAGSLTEGGEVAASFTCSREQMRTIEEARAAGKDVEIAVAAPVSKSSSPGRGRG